MKPSSSRESERRGRKGLEGLCSPVPVRGHAGADPAPGRAGAGGLRQRPSGGTRREAVAPPGTFLLSSSWGWKIYKARSENIYTAAIFGGIWDVNLKNLWGEDHNGPFERASVAIAPTHPRRRGAPPAAAPALMGASPAGSPPGSRGGCARRPPPPPRAPNCIQRRSLPPSAPGERDRGDCGVGASQRAASILHGTVVTLGSAGGSRGVSAPFCSFSPNQTYLGGQGPNLENSSPKDKGLEND